MTWLTAGIVLTGVAGWLLRLAPVPALAVAAVAAFTWQITPVKGRCLNRVHTHPALPASGHAADLGALRLGLTHAMWCVGTCWALMLIPLVTGAAAPFAMTAVALWLAAERFERPTPPRWRPRVPTLAARTLWRTCRATD